MLRKSLLIYKTVEKDCCSCEKLFEVCMEVNVIVCMRGPLPAALAVLCYSCQVDMRRCLNLHSPLSAENMIRGICLWD